MSWLSPKSPAATAVAAMAITATVIPAVPAEASTQPIPVVVPATGPHLVRADAGVTTLPLAVQLGSAAEASESSGAPKWATPSPDPSMAPARPSVASGGLREASTASPVPVAPRIPPPVPPSAPAVPPPVAPPSETGSLGERAVALAATLAGIPYVYGGAFPGQGFDCSGLVQYVYGKLGVSLPRTTEAQYEATEHVPQANEEVGDLVFFGNPGAIYHVGIYAGDGRMWVAPHSGAVVQLEAIWSADYHVGRVQG